MAYLPYESTKVTEQKSMMEVMMLLEETGFDKTAHVNTGGMRTIHAGYKGAEFRFQVELKPIVDAIIQNSSKTKQREIRMASPRGKAALEDIQEQSRRVGWRLMAIHIKALCDSIKLGVISPAQAFGGHLVIGTGSNITTLADHLTVAIESGDMKSPGFLAPLALLPAVEID